MYMCLNCYCGKHLSVQASIFEDFLGVARGMLPYIGILMQIRPGLSGE